MDIVTDYEMQNHNLIVAALEYIESELDRIMWNCTQEEYNSPFRNTGEIFELPVFKVRAYDWGFEQDESSPTQPEPNFQWKDYKLWWYKNLGRGDYANRKLSNDEIAQMLDECLEALRGFELYLEETGGVDINGTI